VTDNRRPPGTDESCWIASSPSTSYPALTSDVTVDAAVIGGGIAGICTAWELTKTGRSVALLEADPIVTGTTGYTTAKLTALHGMIYAQLRSSFDDEVAQLYARSQTDPIEHVAATVHDLGIGCDFERRPALTYVESSEQVDLIGDEVAAAQAAGLPAPLVTETGLPVRSTLISRRSRISPIPRPSTPPRGHVPRSERATGRRGRRRQRTTRDDPPRCAPGPRSEFLSGTGWGFRLRADVCGLARMTAARVVRRR